MSCHTDVLVRSTTKYCGVECRCRDARRCVFHVAVKFLHSELVVGRGRAAFVARLRRQTLVWRPGRWIHFVSCVPTCATGFKLKRALSLCLRGENDRKGENNCVLATRQRTLQ